MSPRGQRPHRRRHTRPRPCRLLELPEHRALTLTPTAPCLGRLPALPPLHPASQPSRSGRRQLCCAPTERRCCFGCERAAPARPDRAEKPRCAETPWQPIQCGARGQGTACRAASYRTRRGGAAEGEQSPHRVLPRACCLGEQRNLRRPQYSGQPPEQVLLSLTDPKGPPRLLQWGRPRPSRTLCR